MAPSRLPPCKVCSKKEGGKYRCPIDHVDYCSVVCFKQHKEKDCRSESTYSPPPLPLLAPSNDKDDLDERPTKRLKDLHWPAEPSDLLWDDPLQRDDVKPLRPFEFEAIATSTQLRALLASSSLRTTLTRLTSLPRYAREPSLRVLLSLPPDPTPSQYRPDPARKFATGLTTREEQIASERNNHHQQQHSPNYRGRGTRGRDRGRGGSYGSGRSGTRLLESTPEERNKIEGFAKEVRRIIQEARDKKG
ncbi:hypothetical protein JCM16303_002679 [Sporobolomyces ruberrimus]